MLLSVALTLEPGVGNKAIIMLKGSGLQILAPLNSITSLLYFGYTAFCQYSEARFLKPFDTSFCLVEVAEISTDCFVMAIVLPD